MRKFLWTLQMQLHFHNFIQFLPWANPRESSGMWVAPDPSRPHKRSTGSCRVLGQGWALQIFYNDVCDKYSKRCQKPLRNVINKHNFRPRPLIKKYFYSNHYSPIVRLWLEFQPSLELLVRGLFCTVSSNLLQVAMGNLGLCSFPLSRDPT